MVGLKRIRQSRKMSAEALAQAVGTSRQAVYDWESGQYWPKASSLPRIAEALGCTIDELFREERIEAKEELPWS